MTGKGFAAVIFQQTVIPKKSADFCHPLASATNHFPLAAMGASIRILEKNASAVLSLGRVEHARPAGQDRAAPILRVKIDNRPADAGNAPVQTNDTHATFPPTLQNPSTLNA